MSVATHRTALVALLNTVPDIGRVHGFQRYVREENAFKAVYLYTAPPMTPHLRGWQVSHTSEQRRTLGLGRVLRKHGWTVRGYLTLNDEEQSELVFDGLCEAVADAYEADPTLGGVCTAEMYGDEPDGVQKLDAGPVVFCGVLCHSAVLQLQTWGYS